MVLSDKRAYQNIIGCLMLNPSLFLAYDDIKADDFDVKCARFSFAIIKTLYEAGAQALTPMDVDMEMEKHESTYIIYQKEHGLDFLKECYATATPGNFELSYKSLKKYSLLRRLKKEQYDISAYYLEDKDIQSPLQEIEVQKRFDEASIEDILNNTESKYNIIRNDYLNGGHLKGDPADGLMALIEELKTSPNVGPSLEGEIFSTTCRGAREGCFYLKSSSSGSGKTRTSVFDACHIAFPERWSFEEECFVEEVDYNGEFRKPRKTLFIVTEMDKEELQTIMLAYLSGVNEDHILTGKYEFGEDSRVKYAARIIEKYHEYFMIEEVSDPNLNNIQATIKKYATIEKVKYVFFDYIHSTASLIGQFERNALNEATILMMMANQLKQLAKDYSLFIFSATQVNVNAMDDDGEFKNEMSIRGAKSIADKADLAYIMTKIGPKAWNSLLVTLKKAVAQGLIDKKYLEDDCYKPTHILDIYKMRRGRYKNVRIWINLNLGNGYRKDLFITNADNYPLTYTTLDIFSSSRYVKKEDWNENK